MVNMEIEIIGLLVGYVCFKINVDVMGIKVFGIMGNCVGGVMFWGMILMVEENF